MLYFIQVKNIKVVTSETTKILAKEKNIYNFESKMKPEIQQLYPVYEEFLAGTQQPVQQLLCTWFGQTVLENAGQPVIFKQAHQQFERNESGR